LVEGARSAWVGRLEVLVSPLQNASSSFAQKSPRRETVPAMADKKTKSVMDMVRKKVADRARLRQQQEAEAAAANQPTQEPTAEAESEVQPVQVQPVQPPPAHNELGPQSPASEPAVQSGSGDAKATGGGQLQDALATGRERAAKQLQASVKKSKEATEQAQGPTFSSNVDPDMEDILTSNMQSIKALFTRYATEGVTMDVAQLVSLAANHNIVPDPFEMSAAEDMFGRCSHAGQSEVIDCNGFCDWLAIASRELQSRGVVQQVFPGLSSCLGLLLARMDTNGAMFGRDLQERYGDAARDLASYTTRAEVQDTPSSHRDQSAGTAMNRPAARPRGASRRMSAYEPTASYQAKRYTTASASSPTTQHLNSKLAALHKQVQDEQTKELTFKPNINQKYVPKGSFSERMSKAEETKRLKLVRMKQEEYEREEASMNPSKAMNSRSKHLLEKKGQLHVQQKVHVSKMHASKKIHMKRWQKENQKLSTTDQETGQPLFKPVVNPASSRALKDRHGTGYSDVSESLYRNAMNRKVRHQMAAKQIELNHQDLRNSVKMNASSFAFIRKRLVREVKHMFSLYDSDSEGSLNYTRMIEMLRDLGVLKNSTQTNTQQRQNELRTERSRLLRLWSDLVADGSSGVSLNNITEFVLAVVLGRMHNGKVTDLDRELVNEFRDEYLVRTKNNPRGTFSFVDGSMSGSGLYGEHANDEECTFQPMICDRSRKLEAKTRMHVDEQQPMNREDLLLHKARAAEDRAAVARQRKAQEEMAECTFAPVINQYYPDMDKDGGGDPGSSQPRSELLYQNYLRKKAANDEGFVQHKTTLDQEVEVHCTFKPQLATSSSGYNEQPSSVPRGYARDIERMREATKKREQAKLEREEMGRSISGGASKGPRSKAVQPFAFASEMRSIKRKEQRMEKARANQSSAVAANVQKKKVRVATEKQEW
jgi:hypothetical protein